MSIYHIHHIVPRHMGGTDDSSNLIKLTVEEHALAHKKLYEEYGNEYDRIAWLGLESRISSEECRILAVKQANTGRKQTKEHIEKRMTANKKTFEKNGYPTQGKKLPKASPERKSKISKALKGKSNWHKGKKRTSETKLKQSLATKNRVILTCKKCGASMQKANLVRYHGINGEKCLIL
jgi:hypothetical protein